MIQYNLNLLRNLFEDLHYLIKTTVSFFDDNFLATSVHSKRRVNHLCVLVKDEWNCRHNCAVSDERCFQRFRDGENSFYYSCHFGFIEMAFRFAVNNVTYGYVIIGPFRDKKNSKETLERIKRCCGNNPELLEKTLQLYQQIPTFSLEKYYAIKNISFAIFDYAKNHNIISEKSNLFSEQIEPYILSNLKEPLTIEGLCKKFFLTQKQLYNMFEKNTHKTPKRYVNEQRVNQARHLIITTNMPLAEIASSVGVDDYNYFIKIFKSYDGHTPMHYRKH